MLFRFGCRYRFKRNRSLSIVENRELTTQPILDFGHCLNKSSQESIEKFLNDQILFGEKMKRLYHEVENR